MPKSIIDYSNTVIYKIYCKDQTIKDVYVGHTTNFIKRKYQHKILSSDNKQQTKIYKTIRENGGWSNWNMVELATYSCKDSTEARIREREHYDLLNPNLDAINTESKCDSLDEINENINIQNTNTAIIEPVNVYTKMYSCKYCDYKSIRKFNWERHILSCKNIIYSEGDALASNMSKLSKDEHMDEYSLSKYICVKCDKKYSSRNGLWKHKKTHHKDDDIDNDISDKELIMMLLKENSEFKNMIMKVVEKGTNNNSNNNINSNNKAFNLNVFLNETCKDAMNMSDFVSSIKLTLEDLENTGRKGYVDGVSDIIVKHLNEIEDHLRPLHCSDTKREILYVKDNDKWEKETNEKPILTKAIKIIANENIKQIKHWRERYPDCTSSTSRKNDLYLKIVSNSMNGLTDEESKKNISKIITNLAKNTAIQKK